MYHSRKITVRFTSQEYDAILRALALKTNWRGLPIKLSMFIRMTLRDAVNDILTGQTPAPKSDKTTSAAPSSDKSKSFYFLKPSQKKGV